MSGGNYWLPKATTPPPPPPPAPPLPPSLRLTDQERWAIAYAADLLIGSRQAATLRKLLDRLHT